MITKGIRNFFINLKHFFTPLGALALGVIIGLSVFIPGVIGVVEELADRVAQITGNASVSFDALKDSLAAEIGALDWGRPADAFHTVLSEDWLTATLYKCINAFVSGDTAAAQISEAVNSAINGIGLFAAILIVWTIIGLLGGFFLTKFLVRRNMARRSLWKFILASVLDSVLAVALIFVSVWLEALYSAAGIIAGILSLVLLGFVSLTEAYLVHGRKKVPLKQAVSIKNILKLLLVDIIIIIITLLLSVIAFAVSNSAIGAFICLPLIEIALIVMSLNAEAYVKDLAAAYDE